MFSGVIYVEEASISLFTTSSTNRTACSRSISWFSIRFLADASAKIVKFINSYTY